MSNVTLLVTYLDGLEKLAENAVARRSEEGQPPARFQNGHMVDPDTKRDLAVGAVYAGGNALKQGIKAHKKEKRKKEMWQGVADGWRSARAKAKESKESSQNVVARLNKKENKKGELNASQSMARMGHRLNAAPGVATAKSAAGGVKGAIVGGIKRWKGIDEEKPKSDFGKAMKTTGSVAGKTFGALGNKKNSAAFRQGMAHSQIARSLGA